MSLSDRIKARLTALNLQQKTAAITWMEAWNEAHPDDPVAVDTAEARLSEFIRGKDRGLRFFLDNPQRFTALLTVLEVPEPERAEWRAEADAARAHGPGGRPRLVVDLTGIAETRDEWEAMFVAVEGFVAQPALIPMRVIVPDAGFRWLPRTFDNRAEVIVERVADAAAAEALVHKHTAPGVLVITPASGVPDEQWAVPYRDNMAWKTEPPDAVGLWLQNRELPGPASPELTLRSLFEQVPAQHQPALRNAVTETDGTWLSRSTRQHEHLSPADVRRLRVTLSDPTHTHRNLTWGERLDLGDMVGVPAAATHNEQALVSRWLTHLDFDPHRRPESVDQAALDGALRRATQRKTSDVLLFVGEVLHIINPTIAVEPSPLVVVHTIEHEVPVLQRMMEMVGDWTAYDLDDDPDLLGPCMALAGEGFDPKLILHARASIDPETLPVKDTTDVTDPWDHLARTLAMDPPEPEFFVEASPFLREMQIPDIGVTDMAPGLLPLRGGDLILRCGEPVLLHTDHRGADRGSAKVALPTHPRDVHKWLDAIDATSWITPKPARAPNEQWSRWPSRAPKSLTISDSTREDAIWQVVTLWHVLRLALRQTNAVRSPDAWWLLPIGGPMCVEFYAERRANTGASTLRVCVPVDPDRLAPRQIDIDGTVLAAWFRITSGDIVFTIKPRLTPWGKGLARVG